MQITPYNLVLVCVCVKAGGGGFEMISVDPILHTHLTFNLRIIDLLIEVALYILLSAWDYNTYCQFAVMNANG